MKKSIILFVVFSFILIFPVSSQSIDVEVVDVKSKYGKFNIILDTTILIEALISNNSSVNIYDTPVTLNITGSNTFSIIDTIPVINSGDTASILFQNISVSNIGSQVINVSILNDANNANNSLDYIQEIICDTLSYANNSAITNGVGYNTGGGILTSKFDLTNNLPLKIPKMAITIGVATNNVGNTINGVLLNSNGVIVDSTLDYIITTNDLGNKVVLDYINGDINYSNNSVYVGIRQIANPSVGYFPMAIQWPPIEMDNVFYGFGENGGVETNYTNLGIWMIEAIVEVKVDDLNITTSAFNNMICTGSQLTINANYSGFDNYQFIIDGLVAQSGITDFYTYTPVGDIEYQVSIDRGGCLITSNADSIYSVHEMITNLDETICDNDTYNFGGLVLNSTGQYIDTLSSIGGCDSIVTLDLEANNSSIVNLIDTICDGDLYFFSNMQLSQSGTYGFTVSNSVGCDSVVSLDLTVLEVDYTINKSICYGTIYTFYDQSVSNPGTYFHAAPNPNGCDTLITLELTVEQFVLNVSQIADTLFATGNSSGLTYQWIDCSDNSDIVGATDSVFVPGVTGNYAVVITKGGCIKTSDCFMVDYTSIKKVNNDLIKIYPNPSENELFVIVVDAQVFNYTIYDMNSRMVKEDKSISNNQMIGISNLESGIYLIKITYGDEIIYKNFVKE